MENCWTPARKCEVNGETTVFCNGYFYCLAVISGPLVGYNIVERTSIFIPLPDIVHGHSMVRHRLICAGSWVLVAAYIFGFTAQLLEVIIWELEKVEVNS